MKKEGIKHSSVQKLKISEDQSGQRIDNFLLNYLKSIPKTRIYKMLRKGEVRVNGGRIKPLYKLKNEDEVRIPPVHQKEMTSGPSINLDKVKSLEKAIIYESSRLIVLNKPAGMAVHGGSGLSFGVIEAMRSLRPAQKYLELVHRLDRATSGCLLIAKRRSTLRYLHKQLREHQIIKVYHALVSGHWDPKLKKVDSSLEKQILKSGERISVVSSEGKKSCTHFKMLESYQNCSLVEAKPLTGRTHQIRVHCASSGHPICGDLRYDENKLSTHNERLFLHAHSIKFKEKEDLEIQTVTSEKDSLWMSVIESLS